MMTKGVSFLCGLIRAFYKAETEGAFVCSVQSAELGQKGLSFWLFRVDLIALGQKDRPFWPNRAKLPLGTLVGGNRCLS